MQFYFLHHWKWRKLRIALPVNIAPFTKEDKNLIKSPVYEYKDYNARQLITEFPISG